MVDHRFVPGRLHGQAFGPDPECGPVFLHGFAECAHIEPNHSLQPSLTKVRMRLNWRAWALQQAK